jgi:hypothetical protein
LILISTAASQVKIKERIEIKPSGSIPSVVNSVPFGITLPPLNMSDFKIFRSGFWDSYDEIYDDRIFVPRIGGKMDLSVDITNGSVEGRPQSEYLLVFGPDGNIRNQFFLGDLDSCALPPVYFWQARHGGQELVYYDNSYTDSVCYWNPWYFNQERY